MRLATISHEARPVAGPAQALFRPRDEIAPGLLRRIAGEAGTAGPRVARRADRQARGVGAAANPSFDTPPPVEAAPRGPALPPGGAAEAGIAGLGAAEDTARRMMGEGRRAPAHGAAATR